MATKRRRCRVAGNKGKIVGQKAPLKLREIWAFASAFSFAAASETSPYST
jgi:hypothetical protein